MVEQIPPFGNHLPVRIRFGEGVIAGLPEILRGERCSHTFVVIDEVVQGHPAGRRGARGDRAGGGV